VTINMFELEPYISRSSPVHRLDARVKLAVVVLYIVVLTSLPLDVHFSWPLAFWGLILLAIWAARLPLGAMLSRSTVALPFALAALALVFTTPGQPLFSVAWGSLHLTATAEGLVRFLSILLKSWLGLQAALILSATTPFTQLLCGLRSLGLPPLLVSMLGFMYRYLFVLVDEVRRMMAARDARSARPDRQAGGTLAWRAKVTGQMAGTLFLRSYERSERIYLAMRARGFDGEIRSAQQLRLQGQDALVAGTSLLILAVVVLSYSVLSPGVF